MSAYEPPTYITPIFNPTYYTNATKTYVDTTTTQTIGGSKTFSNEIIGNNGIDIGTGSSYQINNTSVLSSTTLGSSVVNSSLTSIGTLAQNLNLSNSSYDYRIGGTSVLNSTTLGSNITLSSLGRVGTAVSTTNTWSYTITGVSTNQTTTWTGSSLTYGSNTAFLRYITTNFTVPVNSSSFKFQLPINRGIMYYVISDSQTNGSSTSYSVAGNILLTNNQTTLSGGIQKASSVNTLTVISSNISTVTMTTSSTTTYLQVNFAQSGGILAATPIYIYLYMNLYSS